VSSPLWIAPPTPKSNEGQSSHSHASLDEAVKRVFTPKGAEESYRVLIEETNQGVVTLSADGSILYCNRRFADLLKMPIEKIVSLDFSAFVALSERAGSADLLEMDRVGGSAGEITLCAGNENAVPL
jgi:PAS domain-containing protein